MLVRSHHRGPTTDATRTWRARLAMAALVVAAGLSPASADAEEREGTLRPDEAAALEQMQAGLNTREYARVIVEGEDLVEAIEARSHRYDTDLIAPLSLLAEALLRGGDAVRADGVFERALHLVRVNDGPVSLSQLPLVYRQADARKRMGARGLANDREEFALDLLIRGHGIDSPEIIDGLMRLGDWYAQNRYHISARIIYKHLTALAEEHLPEGDARTLHAWRGYAESYRRIVWPMPRRPNTGGFRTGPPLDLYDWRILQGYDPFEHYHLRRRAHDKGELAFKTVIGHLEATGTTAELAEAMLELADLHMLYRRYSQAYEQYREVRATLASDPEALAQAFDKPVPIYLPLPTGRGQARGSWKGVVELALTITHRGDVVGRRTVRAEPGGIIEHRVRMAARRARYRPAFDGDHPIKSVNVPLEYTYSYLPGTVASR